MLFKNNIYFEFLIFIIIIISEIYWIKIYLLYHRSAEIIRKPIII